MIEEGGNTSAKGGAPTTGVIKIVMPDGTTKLGDAALIHKMRYWGLSDIKRVLQANAAEESRLRKATPGLRMLKTVNAIVHNVSSQPTWEADVLHPLRDVSKHRCTTVPLTSETLNYIPSESPDPHLRPTRMSKPLAKLHADAAKGRRLIPIVQLPAHIQATSTIKRPSSNTNNSDDDEEGSPRRGVLVTTNSSSSNVVPSTRAKQQQCKARDLGDPVFENFRDELLATMDREQLAEENSRRARSGGGVQQQGHKITGYSSSVGEVPLSSAVVLDLRHLEDDGVAPDGSPTIVRKTLRDIERALNSLAAKNQQNVTDSASGGATDMKRSGLQPTTHTTATSLSRQKSTLHKRFPKQNQHGGSNAINAQIDSDAAEVELLVLKKYVESHPNEAAQVALAAGLYVREDYARREAVRKGTSRHVHLRMQDLVAAKIGPRSGTFPSEVIQSVGDDIIRTKTGHTATLLSGLRDAIELSAEEAIPPLYPNFWSSCQNTQKTEDVSSGRHQPQHSSFAQSLGLLQNGTHPSILSTTPQQQQHADNSGGILSSKGAGGAGSRTSMMSMIPPHLLDPTSLLPGDPIIEFTHPSPTSGAYPTTATSTAASRRGTMNANGGSTTSFTFGARHSGGGSGVVSAENSTLHSLHTSVSPSPRHPHGHEGNDDSGADDGSVLWVRLMGMLPLLSAPNAFPSVVIGNRKRDEDHFDDENEDNKTKDPAVYNVPPLHQFGESRFLSAINEIVRRFNERGTFGAFLQELPTDRITQADDHLLDDNPSIRSFPTDKLELAQDATFHNRPPSSSASPPPVDYSASASVGLLQPLKAVGAVGWTSAQLSSPTPLSEELHILREYSQPLHLPIADSATIAAVNGNTPTTHISPDQATPSLQMKTSRFQSSQTSLRKSVSLMIERRKSEQRQTSVTGLRNNSTTSITELSATLCGDGGGAPPSERIDTNKSKAGPTISPTPQSTSGSAIPKKGLTSLRSSVSAIMSAARLRSESTLLQASLRRRDSPHDALIKGSDVDEVLARARASQLHASITSSHVEPDVAIDAEAEAAKLREHERRLKASLVDACRKMLPQRTEASKLFELMKSVAMKDIVSNERNAAAHQRKNQLLDEDFDSSCIICWSHHIGGKANDAASRIEFVPAHIRESMKLVMEGGGGKGGIDLDSKNEASERALLLRSSDNAADALKHWKAMHLHVTLDKRQALETALQNRDRSSSSVNKNSRQLANLSEAAMGSGHAWYVSQSSPSSSSQRMLRKSLPSSSSNNNGRSATRPGSRGSSREQSPPTTGGGGGKVRSASRGKHGIGTKGSSPSLDHSPSGTINSRPPAQLPELTDEEAHFLREYMGHVERERDLSAPAPDAAATSKGSASTSSSTAIVRLPPLLGGGKDHHSTALSSLGQGSTLHSMWTRPEQEMLIAQRDWLACQIFWTRLSIICAGLRIPSTPSEMTLLATLNKMIQRERMITRGMFFVWLRAQCLPPPAKSSTVSRTVSRTAARANNNIQITNAYGASFKDNQSGIQYISHNRNGYRLFIVLRLLLGIPPKAVNDWLDLPSSKAIPALRNFPRDQEPLTT